MAGFSRRLFPRFSRISFARIHPKVAWPDSAKGRLTAFIREPFLGFSRNAFGRIHPKAVWHDSDGSCLPRSSRRPFCWIQPKIVWLDSVEDRLGGFSRIPFDRPRLRTLWADKHFLAELSCKFLGRIQTNAVETDSANGCFSTVS